MAEVGNRADRVRILLGGNEAKICETYEVTVGVLQQPSSFALRLGHGDVARQILAKVPPNTDFSLQIGDYPQFSGSTDGYEAEEGTGATEVTLRGRGYLKRLLMRSVVDEIALQDATYPELVKRALSECGLGDRILQTSNAANRKIRSGSHVLARIEPRTLDEIIADPSAGGKTIQTVQAKIGETWWRVVESKLLRAGLFLWDDAEGNFVLSQPNGAQNPLARIIRWRGRNPNLVNATRSSFRNDTSRRHSEVIVRSRTGGKRRSRVNVKGRFADDEMLALGYDCPLVIRDAKATSDAEAEFLARRRLAEERRDGWHLSYTVAGHTTSSLVAGSGRAVWTPDTVIEVKDDEYGLDGLFYLESCSYRGDPEKTETQLTLMRIGDLIFGSDEEE